MITCGYTTRTTEELLELVNILEEKNCVGLVINEGEYIEKVPPEVVQRCRELNLSLMTMPWGNTMSDFAKYSCGRINQSANDTEELSQAAIHVFLLPKETGEYSTTHG